MAANKWGKGLGNNAVGPRTIRAHELIVGCLGVFREVHHGGGCGRVSEEPRRAVDGDVQASACCSDGTCRGVAGRNAGTIAQAYGRPADLRAGMPRARRHWSHGS